MEAKSKFFRGELKSHVPNTPAFPSTIFLSPNCFQPQVRPIHSAAEGHSRNKIWLVLLSGCSETAGRQEGHKKRPADQGELEQKGQAPGAFTDGEGPAVSTGVQSGDSLWKGWFERKGDKRFCVEKMT